MFNLIFLSDNKYHFCRLEGQLCQNLDNNILHRNQSKNQLINLQVQLCTFQEGISLVIMSLFHSNIQLGRDNCQDLSLQSHYKVNQLDKSCNRELMFKVDQDQKFLLDTGWDFKLQVDSRNLPGKQSFQLCLLGNNSQQCNQCSLCHSLHLLLRMYRCCTLLA